ncbi:MAG: hypothetical protein KC503_24325 [Myxococcales bacterium]|nr:hypothetical protein [Myxococcales bacterium]
MPPLSKWLVAFALTLAIELPLYWLLLRRALGDARALGVGVGVNLATHPALWYLMPRFLPYGLWLAVSETLVFVLEGLLVAFALRSRTPLGTAAATTRGLGIALLVNAISTALGLLLLR